MITNVAKVVVPVDDQQAALEFWTQTMGFRLVSDMEYGDERWIEVEPPEQALLLVLSPRRPDQQRPEPPPQLPHSPVFFDCADLEATHRELAGRGVKFPAPPMQLPFGWWSMFEDHEGTRFVLGQWNSESSSRA